MARLSYGADINHSATAFTGELLSSLLDAVRHPETGKPVFGGAKFSSAIFLDEARFDSVQFTGEAIFQRASFHESAHFTEANFQCKLDFQHANLNKELRFERVSCHDLATFSAATIQGGSSFNDTTFSRLADFSASRFARASFLRATFKDRCSFSEAAFDKRTRFTNSRFYRTVDFSASSFRSLANFSTVDFNSLANFSGATINHAAFEGAAFGREANFQDTVFDRASFSKASFTANTAFDRAKFAQKSFFTESVFSKAVSFRGTEFNKDVHFVRVTFEQAEHIGPIASRGTVVFNGSRFDRQVTLEISAVDITLRRVQWSSTGIIRVRKARVDLSDSNFNSSMIVSTAPNPFPILGGRVLADPPTDNVTQAKITSLRGADVARLLLVDLDLSECLFAGSIHLDQLRLEGDCQFAYAPRGIYLNGWRPSRWSSRRVLAEEVKWRSRSSSPRGWGSLSLPEASLSPAAVSALYRHLRKSFEDSKNEPDAADFYYGEMEMRRNDENRPWSERYLLAAYWLVSGYGLRAGRALSWLICTMIATLTSLVFWGLPIQAPTTVSKGIISGNTFEEVTKATKPVNPSGSLRKRATSKRFEKSLSVVINSVAFRSSGEPLTTSGKYIEMSSRIVEPIFLGLAILAVRSRIKR